MNAKIWTAAAALAAVAITGCSAVRDAVPTKTVTAAAVTTTTTKARYDSQLDETFLAQMRLHEKFKSTSKKDLIDLAHSTCDAADAGNKAKAVQILVDEYGLSDGATFAHSAISVYCPEHLANG